MKKIHAIVSPRFDFWAAGGVSICMMTFAIALIFLSSPTKQSVAQIMSNFFIFQVLINWPHFLAAYSLLYRHGGSKYNYPYSRTYVPFILIAILLVSIDWHSFSLTNIRVNQDSAYFIWLVASIYLAWHYVGQSWGLFVTFSHLSNLRLQSNEFQLLKKCFRTLIAWHVVWGCQDLPEKWFFGYKNYYDFLLFFFAVVTVFSFVISAAILLNKKFKSKEGIDSRVWVVWVSIYIWYLALFIEPSIYPLVQLSHALQYLMFPIRIELNELSQKPSNTKQVKVSTWLGIYYVLLIILGILIFWVPESISSNKDKFTFVAVISMLIAIHHYFVDGEIWKLSNKEVKSKLFFHIRS